MYLLIYFIPTNSHSFGEQFSLKKWAREIAGQREILSAYGGVKQEDIRGMRAPFLSIGGNRMFKMLHDFNFTYDSSMPVYENRPPSWPYTLDYKLFHDCMIPPCPTKSYPGVWEVPMVMWQDLNGGRCSMGDACSNPADAEGVTKMIMKNFDRHYTTNRAPFGLYYHAAWFTQPHHKEGFIKFLDTINAMNDVYIVTNWQALQWVRDPTPISRINSFQPFQCNNQVSFNEENYLSTNQTQIFFFSFLTINRTVRSVVTARRFAICGTSLACVTCEHVNHAQKFIHGLANLASNHQELTTIWK